MKIRLELAHKKAKVKKVLLKADTIIGRSTDCGLRIASNEVSRQHCKICIGEDGVTVRDLGSSNGTFVNGYQLEPDTDYEIAPDSELSLGGIKFFVRFSEPAEKVMQTDGLGSTVDLKPNQKEELAALEQTARYAEPEEDEMQFAEATESDAEFAGEEEMTGAEVEPAGESGGETEMAEEESAVFEDEEDATVNMERPGDVASVVDEDEADYEMSTYGDSAILEREEAESEADDSPEEEAVVDLELDVEDAESPNAEEVVDLELEEESDQAAEDEVVDLELEDEGTDPVEQEEFLDEEAEDESESEAEVEADVEPAVAAEEEIAIPEAEDEEMSEDDVAAFLNQVSDEDEATDNEDESLGDFFKQFD